MKLAFIGGYGHHLLRPMLRDGAVRVEGVAMAGDGIDDQRAKEFGQRLGEHRWYPDARIMLDEFKPDLVNVGAVYAHNATWAQAALEAGAVVMCEKPIASSGEQLKQLRATLAKTGGLLLTEFSFRCHPAFLGAHKVIKAGRIGQPVLVTGQKSYRFGKQRPAWYGSRAEYGGTVGWVASHAIDYAWFCAQRPFDAVIGHQGNLSKADYPELEEYTVSLFRLDNGGSCVIHADFLRPDAAPTHGDDRLRIVGTEGQVEIMQQRAVLISDREGYRDVTDADERMPVHAQVLAAMAGRESVFSNRDSLYIAEVLLAAREAGDRNEWVSIDPPPA